MDLTLDPGRNNGSWFNIADSNASADVFGNLTIPPHQYYATELWKYFPPILILLGTFGNILTILILCRKSMWKMSSSPYLVVLGVADIVVLYTGLLRQWLRYVVDTDIRELSPVVCRLHIFSVYVSIDYSVWILVAVSVERFIGVCFPFKAKTFCTRRRTQITLFVIFCLLAILNSHFFFGFGSSFDNSTGVPVLISHCTVLTNEYALFTENIWPWVDLAVFSMIPFCLIIVCNISLIFRVVYSRRRHRVAPTDAHTTSGVSTSSMTALLISLNTLFLFTTAPISIYLIGYPRWSRTADYNEFALLNLCWAIVNFLMYLNNSLNFILYCLSGPRFRREIKLICARRHKVGVLKLTMPSKRPQSQNVHPERLPSQPSFKQPVNHQSPSQQPVDQLMHSEQSITHPSTFQQSFVSSKQSVPSNEFLAQHQNLQNVGLHNCTPSTLKSDPTLLSDSLENRTSLFLVQQTKTSGPSKASILEADTSPGKKSASLSVV